MTSGPHRAASVVPGVCSGGQCEIETTCALVSSYRHEYGSVLDDIDAEVSGPRLYSARTRIVRRLLDGDGEWLWWLDTDMGFEADAPFRLLAAADPTERPIVGGLCFGTGRSGGPLFPTIFVESDGVMGVVHDYPRDTLVECDGTGMAFCLVHRTVFEKMAEHYAYTPDGHPDLFPWFVDGQIGAAEMEADLAFCLRARRLGFPVHVHTGVKTAHKKVQFLTEDFYDFVRCTQEAS